ncbi:unnamed protein product [Heterosigma akashiwo]
MKEMVEAQREDPFCAKCVAYLKDGSLPDSPKECNFIVAHARLMGIHPSGALCHYWDTVGEYRRRVRRVQIVVPQSEAIKKKLLRWAHGAGTTAHLGSQKAFPILRSSYWWKNMFGDLVEFTRTCLTCQKQKNPHARLRARPGPCRPPIPDGPGHTVHIDALTIMGTTCVVMVDAFSRYPEVWISPRKNITGDMLCEALLTHWISKHGCMAVLVADSVRYQSAGSLPEFCDLLGIRLHNTTPFRPQANGSAESRVKTVKQLIRSLAHENPSKWKSMMSLALLVYRCSFHRSTGQTPFYLTHGREAVLPAKFSRAVESILQDTEIYNPGAYAVNLANRMREAFRVATHNIKKSRATLQHQALLPEYFSVGDRVLLFTPKVKKSTDLFHDSWSGDFIISRKISKIIHEIQRVDKPSDVRRVHVNRLKKRL